MTTSMMIRSMSRTELLKRWSIYASRTRLQRRPVFIPGVGENLVGRTKRCCWKKMLEGLEKTTPRPQSDSPNELLFLLDLLAQELYYGFLRHLAGSSCLIPCVCYCKRFCHVPTRFQKADFLIIEWYIFYKWALIFLIYTTAFRVSPPRRPP